MDKPSSFNIKLLFQSAGIEPLPEPGIVDLYEHMEKPEENPDDEWIKLGLVAMKDILRTGYHPRIVADIGTGNGILAIAMADIFRPQTIYLTDIVESVLPHCVDNLRKNIGFLNNYNPEIISLSGRDAEPLPNNCIDLFVFSPAPLMVEDVNKLGIGLSRTTLTERDYYMQHSENIDSDLIKWSLLPWYVFLLRVKQKMKKNSIVLGLYSGRIPFGVIEKAYRMAGLSLRVLGSMVKKQQDPIYLKEYANYESKYLNGDTFYFYSYKKAQKLLLDNNITMPGLINLSDEKIKSILSPAKISANEAYRLSLNKFPVAHLGHALAGTLS